MSNKKDSFKIEKIDMNREEFENEIAEFNRELAERDRKFKIILFSIIGFVAIAITLFFIFMHFYAESKKVDIDKLNSLQGNGDSSYVTDDLCGITSFITRNGKVISTSFSGKETDAEKSKKISEAYSQAKKVVPNVFRINDLDELSDGNISVYAIEFEGMTVSGKNTAVFAYIAFPTKISTQEKLPAVVLVHGGSSHASSSWVKIWAQKGYVALSFDTGGYYLDNSGSFKYGVPDIVSSNGYVVSPKTDYGKSTIPNTIDKMWIYNSTGMTILASNVLRKCSVVDASKIGVVGVSWGSVVESIAIGYDDRFSFAVSIYGSGYLNENLAALNYFKRDEIKKQWLAQKRFSKVKTPVLWLCGNSDSNFSVNTNSRSYLGVLASSPDSILSINSDFDHTQSLANQKQEQFLFADSIVFDGVKPCRFTSRPKGKNPVCTYSIDSKNTTVVSSTLYYSSDKLKYDKSDKIENEWRSSSCSINSKQISVTVPSDAKIYYIEICYRINNIYYNTTTPLVTL